MITFKYERVLMAWGRGCDCAHLQTLSYLSMVFTNLTAISVITSIRRGNRFRNCLKSGSSLKAPLMSDITLLSTNSNYEPLSDSRCRCSVRLCPARQ